MRTDWNDYATLLGKVIDMNWKWLIDPSSTPFHIDDEKKQPRELGKVTDMNWKWLRDHPSSTPFHIDDEEKQPREYIIIIV